MMKGIIDKSRLKKIGKYINRQLIVHRNIENDTKWTTEESMIVELYDNYIELISKINNLQQENKQLKEQRKGFIEWLEKVAYQDVEPSDFVNGCKVAYGCALQKYKEIIGGDK